MALRRVFSRYSPYVVTSHSVQKLALAVIVGACLFAYFSSGRPV